MQLFLSLIFCFPLIAEAQTFSNGKDFIGTTSRSSGTNPGDYKQTDSSSAGNNQNETLGDSGQEIGDSGGFNVTQQGGLDGTNNAQDKGGGVQTMGLAMGSMFAGQCGPHNAFACVAAGLSFADALAGGSAKSAAFEMGTNLDPSLGTNTNGEGNGVDPLIQAQIQDGIQNLSDMGFTLSDDGSVTGPDGTNYTAEDLKSSAALEAKGATPQQAASFMNSLGKIQASAAKKTGYDLEAAAQRDLASLNDGGAGSGFAASSAPGIDGDILIEEVEYRGKRKKKGLADKAAAKLSTNFNGDPIGIGMANLFLIVHQKYVEKKNNKNEFINREY